MPRLTEEEKQARANARAQAKELKALAPKKPRIDAGEAIVGILKALDLVVYTVRHARDGISKAEADMLGKKIEKLIGHWRDAAAD